MGFKNKNAEIYPVDEAQFAQAFQSLFSKLLCRLRDEDGFPITTIHEGCSQCRPNMTYENNTFRSCPPDPDVECICGFDEMIHKKMAKASSEEQENWWKKYDHKPYCPVAKANFYYKPTGFRINWRQDAPQKDYCNKNLSDTELREMIQECLESIKLIVGSKFLVCEQVQLWDNYRLTKLRTEDSTEDKTRMSGAEYVAGALAGTLFSDGG